MLGRLRTVVGRGLESAGVVSTRAAAGAAACTCRNAPTPAASAHAHADQPGASALATMKRMPCAACLGAASLRSFSTSTAGAFAGAARRATPALTGATMPAHTAAFRPTITFRQPTMARSFSATAKSTADAGAEFVAKEEPKPDADKDAGEGEGKTAKGEVEGEGNGDANKEPSFLRKHWLKFLTMGTGGVLYYAFGQGWLSDGYNELLETSFLRNLRAHGINAVPEPGTWTYAFMVPSMIGMSLPFRSMLHHEPETLDKLLDGLMLDGMEQGPLGVSSEELDLIDMVKANWILTLLTAGATASTQDVKALRFAHARSLERQTKWNAEWEKNPKMRAEAYEVFLQKSGVTNAEERAKRVDEFRALTPAQQQARVPTLKRFAKPLTVAEVLIQHGLHHKAKETPQQLEEEATRKYWKTKNDQQEQAIAAAQDEREKQRLRSEAYTVPLRAQQEQELALMLDAMRPLFQRVVSEAIEKQLGIQAWTLLKCLAEPNIKGNGLLLGKSQAVDIEAIQRAIEKEREEVARLRKMNDNIERELRGEAPARSDQGNLDALEKNNLEIAFSLQNIHDYEITAKIRANLLNQWLIPMCIAIVPNLGGAPSRWGVETQASASELLGSLLFDIPDLGQTWKNSHDTVKNALFSALANLAQVYAEGQYPGGAVRAAELVVQCDPQNVQLLTTLAVEKLKLGLAQQLLAKTQSPQQGDLRTNRYLPEALSHLSQALKLDPTNLEASFQMLKTLVATGERDEKVLGSAVDRLIKAVRHSPTTLQPQNIGLLPGQASDAPSPLEETVPQLSPAYNLLIRTLEKLGRVEEAAELASEWSFRVHADALSHFTLGRLQLREGELAAAESTLQTAYDLDPSKPETLYQRALAKYKLGELDQAEEFVQQALDARAKVEKRVRQRVHQQMAAELAQRAADHAAAEHERAMRNEKKDKTDAEAAAPAPPAPAPAPVMAPSQYAVANTIPSVHLLRAKIAAKRGAIDEALAALDQFAQEKPLATEGLILRARLLQQQAKQAEAYATFAQLARVWRERINAPVASMKKVTAAAAAPTKKAAAGQEEQKPTSSSSSGVEVVYRPATTRKAYFDDRRRASEKAIFDQLATTCTRPTGADKKAQQAAFDRNVQEVPAFRSLCEEIQKLKNLK